MEIPLEAKQGYRAPVKYYEPNGRNPDGRCDGNDEPDENSQPGTHAVQARRRPGRNGENHKCRRDNEKGHSGYLMPHAASLALTEGEPALRLYNFDPRLNQQPA